jgi:hypothetical protein
LVTSTIGSLNSTVGRSEPLTVTLSSRSTLTVYRNSPETSDLKKYLGFRVWNLGFSVKSLAVQELISGVQDFGSKV